MEVPKEFVELLESHAEIAIRDTLAHKRFSLRFRSKGARPDQVTWLPLTLEPGQRVVRCSATLLELSEGSVLLGISGATGGTIIPVDFETVETLQPENGLYRVETFNVATGRLLRRTASVRIESVLKVAGAFSPTHPVEVLRETDWATALRLDVSGDATLGKFRFFYRLGDGMAFPLGETASPSSVAMLTVAEPDENPRQILEPRRPRLRRRGSLRRST